MVEQRWPVNVSVPTHSTQRCRLVYILHDYISAKSEHRISPVCSFENSIVHQTEIIAASPLSILMNQQQVQLNQQLDGSSGLGLCSSQTCWWLEWSSSRGLTWRHFLLSRVQEEHLEKRRKPEQMFRTWLMCVVLSNPAALQEHSSSLVVPSGL